MILLFGIVTNPIYGEHVTVFYSLTIPQQEFAAKDIRSALESRGYTVEFKDLEALSDNFNDNKVVIALTSDTGTAMIFQNQGGNALGSPGEQSYILRTTTSPSQSFWIFGGDCNGAMYGGLQMAEYIHFNGFEGSYNEEESPYVRYRGIKFNIPLDKEAPTYFYDNGGTSHREAIRHVWDMDFWTTWFDEMARHRYNVLSLWSPHPFTSMLNMEDEYPGIAIQGVTGYDEDGHPEQINSMTVEEKTAFWKQVMEYGRNRGFGIYFCTWNIFLSTAEGKHGLSDNPDDQETRSYLRKCMMKFLETYPDLSGFGITVGERMGDISNREKEEWAWDTYGRGMMEYAQANPERELVFIHRQHQGDVSDILAYFDPLIALSNVRFDFSFKYSQAHAHAAVKPSYWESRNMENALGPNNLKSWLTVRNDDFYFLHWGDHQFVRDYIKNFPEVGKYVDAFYIGSDGWVFTKEFTSKDPYYKERDALSIQKTWFMQKLWGRISYNPSITDDFFRKHLALKYPEVSSGDLFELWTKASRAIRVANEQVTGTWDLDFKWWPEGWTSNNGFLDVSQTSGVNPMNGSDLCSIQNSARSICNGKLSACTNADQIEQLALDALSILEGIGPVSNPELKLNLRDLEAMADLSMYNAHKIRAATYLGQGNPDEARNAIRQACCFWLKYTDIMDELYTGVDLQRNSSFSNWKENDERAIQDFTGLGGVGIPKCSDEYPWVYIKSPANNALYIEPAHVVIDVLADAGMQSIEKIELIVNDSLVDTDYEYPYGFELSGLQSGFDTLEVVAYDELGNSDSYHVKIIVNNPETMNNVPWVEDFSLPDGSTQDNGLTSWISSRSAGNLFVQNNLFVVNDQGTEGVLRSGTIDISEGPVNISLDLWSGGNLESDDYVALYKIVDGGPETLIGSKTGNQDSRTTIQGSAIGSELVLVIRTRVSYSTEYYYMDDLSVTLVQDEENQVPEVSIISPETGAEFQESDSITVNIEASDPDGSIDRVELSVGGFLVASMKAPPYRFTLTDLSAGNYTFTAIAYDNAGATGNSTIQISIVPREKLSQFITFPELPTVKVGHDDLIPGATASSGLEVSYTSSDGDVAGIENGKIHILMEGTSIITASQAGNEIYDPAPDVSRSLTVSNTTSAGEIASAFHLFPNPATSEVCINLPVEYSLSLFSIEGIEVMKRSHLMGLNEIDISSLNRGVYFVNILGGNVSAHKMVVFQ